MSTYNKVARLELTIKALTLEPLQQTVPGGFMRHTTIVQLEGGGVVGTGEDVTYDTDDQLDFQKRGGSLPLSGTYTIDSFSRHLKSLSLFQKPPKQEAFRNYRRWAFESTALSLALRQANTTLAGVLGLASQPVSFVSSMRLGEPSSVQPLLERLALYPKLRFKLDPVKDWDDKLIAEVAATGAVDTLDLKGHYKGTVVDVETDPELYARLVKAFPDAWIEDADVNPETEPILAPHASRLTWDAPIHSISDIEQMAFSPPTMLNMKPSRFGSIKELFNTYDYCQQHNIGMYGGGQFELGVGRQQIQYLASLFHPDTPNDVAPGGYNETTLRDDLPQSPLTAGQF